MSAVDLLRDIRDSNERISDLLADRQLLIENLLACAAIVRKTHPKLADSQVVLINDIALRDAKVVARLICEVSSGLQPKGMH